MGVRVTPPIIAGVDNIGAIFIGSNVAVPQRSKHIGMSYQFVREFVHHGFLRFIFVCTKDNDVDNFTKNLPGKIHDRQPPRWWRIREKGMALID
jgi:hypothetical protein